MNPHGRFRKRPVTYDGSLRARYLLVDFPEWVKHLPYEEYWGTRQLSDNIRYLLAETEELLVKASNAHLTLEGLDCYNSAAFTAKEWVLWLIQGTREMNANQIKRNYLNIWNLPFAPASPPPRHIKLRSVVLDPALIRHIEREINLLCP